MRRRLKPTWRNEPRNVEIISETDPLDYLSVDYTLRWLTTYDPSYGSDADGRRGIGVWETETDWDPPLTVEDQNRVIHVFADLSAVDQQRITEAIEADVTYAIRHEYNGDSTERDDDDARYEAWRDR